MERRFTPLAVVFGLSLAALLARLWDIQVVQHELWAAESANLVRSFEVDPYVRGTIRDAQGRVLVQDEKVYALEFVWRDFRRGHPLGQVAMMRSLACMRPVGLDETRLELIDAALGYASLTPDELEAFARGEALDAGVDFVPAVPAPRDDRRARAKRARADHRGPRARDLSFYMHRLLGLTPSERRALRSRLREDDAEGGRTFLELAGAVTNQRTEDVRAELEARVLAADERLARLAQLVEWEDGEDRLTTLSVGDRLVELIEEQRRAVDDDAANALFEMAAGFRPSRLDARNLARLELDWLRASLDWDGFRFEQWLESAGGAFDREVSAWLAPHTIARSKIRDAVASSGERAAPADRVVSAVAHAFRADPESWERQQAAPQDWRAVDELVVLASMPARIAGWTREANELARAPLFPFQAPALRESLLEGDALVEAAFAGTLGAEPRATAGFLVNLAADASEWDPEDEPATAAVLRAHHARLQQRVAELFDMLAAEDGEEKGGPIRFVDAALEKAEETLPYILRDRGGRARVVGGRPPMELVLLVGRYAEEFAGFSVRTRTDRRAVALGPDGVPLARQLIGNVRTPRLVDLLRQRPMDEELRALQKKLVLPDEDRARILGLMDEAFRDGEKIGNSGLESMLNRELSGEDGYIEWHGLQDRVQGNRAPIYRGARDGEDVRLTLDQDIQFAAEEVLLRPVFPRDDKGADRSWEDHPVGAIVLARTNGDILAAASVPQRKGDFVPDQTDGQRLSNIDRVLRRPTFQPPGSVVKPLLSVYALDHLGLDPELALCYCDYNQPRLGGDLRNVKHAGWGAVNCNSRAGHSGRFAGRSLRMEEAIRVSCNTYFAALAEKYFGREDMRKAYRLYGFGRATGVRFDDGGRRGGLLEESAFNPRSPLADGREGPLAPQDIQRIGNGLSGVDANVAQVARAYAGLATGSLPELRLVDEIGGTRLERRSVPLGFREESLARVRDAVHNVVHRQFGSAQSADLQLRDLNFELAAKTGSGDYHLTPALQDDPSAKLPRGMASMRKHTWLAGWFPSRAPRYVIVVYCHDTSATASHTAVHVASQFLRRPEIQSFVAEETAAITEGASATTVEAAPSASSAVPVEAASPRPAATSQGGGVR